MKGIWMIQKEHVTPDVVIFYCHGGGFSMGSSYFYLEYLLALLTSLHELGFSNPAIFALEYTLVPLATYPTQLNETLAGYAYCLEKAPSPDKICVAGDSAGGTLVLSLLLYLSRQADGSPRAAIPGMALLLSPWFSLTSPLNQNTRSDYLDANTLHVYAHQYAGQGGAEITDPLISPGKCKDLAWWRRAAPREGFVVLAGSEEVFANECESLAGVLRKAGVEVEARVEDGGIHCWPVVGMFLGQKGGRLRGVRDCAMSVWDRLGRGRMVNGV